MAQQIYPQPQELRSSDGPAPLPIGATVAEVERDLVLQTLARCNGNRTHAARMLGISVRTLRNRIRLYAARGIDVPMPN
jgi:DNA-binding NtrC family response regulator